MLEAAYRRALQEGADPIIVEQMRGGFTAVVAELQGEQEGQTTAFRFDMDALPIRESKLEQHAPEAGKFRSSHEGILHAGAYDGHTTIGLALAERLSNRKFVDKIRLLFQPAEEGVCRAYAMVEKGMLEQVDRLFCINLGSGVPSGHIRGASAEFLSTTKLEALFTGGRTERATGCSDRHAKYSCTSLVQFSRYPDQRRYSRRWDSGQYYCRACTYGY